MSKPGTVTGWKLDRSEREALLRDHPPRYKEAVADHVTLEVGSKSLPGNVRASVVGRTDDGAGVEAMVVTIDGTSRRPDGSTYHITWSLGPGRQAVESNDVLRDRGWGRARSAHPGDPDSRTFLTMSEPRLFLDLDGVLADFDAGATTLLGMSAHDFERKHSRGAFWARLARAPDFYARLPEMADARLLFEAVEHLHPTILTGLPLGKWAAPQKECWVSEHFPGTPIITTMARDKHKHMHAGDVLVDDRETHRAAYEAAGMVFVHHRNARESLRALAKIYPSVKAP